MSAGNSEKYILLDLARGLSALAVCAGHLRKAIVESSENVASSGPLVKLFYFLTSLEHQAVIIFFVLSGFFVGGSVLRKAERFDLRDYATARLLRLWVVLIPALIFTVLMDAAFARFAPGVLAGDYFKTWASGPPPAGYAAGGWVFAGNVLFLQNIGVPTFGTNGVVWSLSSEFWYYAAFPLLAMVLGVVRVGTGARVASGIGLLAMFWMWQQAPFEQPTGFLLGFGIWLMGVGVFVFARRVRAGRRPWGLLLSVGLWIGLLGLLKLRMFVPAPWLEDVLLTLAFLPVCVLFASWPDARAGLLAPLAHFLSKISYTLYLFHFPLTLAIAVWWFGGQRMVPDLVNLLRYAGTLALLVGSGYLFWLLFERHTDAVRKTITSRTKE